MQLLWQSKFPTLGLFLYSHFTLLYSDTAVPSENELKKTVVFICYVTSWLSDLDVIDRKTQDISSSLLSATIGQCISLLLMQETKLLVILFQLTWQRKD